MKCPIVSCRNKNSRMEELCRKDASFFAHKNIVRGNKVFKLFTTNKN